MRRIVVSEFVSLDGIIEDPGGAEGFQYGGWTRPYWNEQIGKVKSEELFASDALLLGRVTYQGFAKAWPTMQDTGEFGERMNGIRKLVVSSTLKTVEWNNSMLIGKDVLGELNRQKSQTGQDILLAGSSRLLQTLVQNDLVDEYRLLVYPVSLGSGKRLFEQGSHASLQLVEARGVGSGVVFLRYAPDRKS